MGKISYILLAEDDLEDVEFFTMAVKEIDPGISISVVNSKKELFESLEHQLPDLLFLDSYIQHESGLETVKQLKTHTEYMNLPVIMYTGASDIQSIRVSLNAGASIYIVKPPTVPKIKSVLHQLFSQGIEKISSLPKQYYIEDEFQTMEPPRNKPNS